MTTSTRPSMSARIIQDSLARLQKEMADKGVADAETQLKEIATKCGWDYAQPVALEAWSPLGGAMSFDDAEEYQEGREYQAKIDDLSWQLRSIIDNVLQCPDMQPGEKGAAIGQAAADFEDRVAAFLDRESQEDPEEEDEEADLLALVMAGSRAFGEVVDDAKAGKRIAGAKLSDIKKAADTLQQVVKWGAYAENDEDANAERHDQLDEDAGITPITEVNAKAGKAGRKERRGPLGLLRRLRLGSKSHSELPDSAFAYIESGGKKVDGKTTPLSLRHYPHHTASGGVDAGLLRAALARIADTSNEQGGKAHLQAHAKAEGIGEAADSSKELVSGFTAFKAADGSWRWISVYSNRYYDREDEVFPAESHKEFVSYVDETKDYPELWTWHQPIVMGRADLVDYDEKNGLALAAGHFLPGMEAAAEHLAAIPDLGVSHGYHYAKEWKGPDGAYSRYRTFEVSPLPRTKAANEITLFAPARVKEDLMLTKEKRDFLVGIHGEAQVAKLEAGLDTLGKDLKESGIGWKEIADGLKAASDAYAAHSDSMDHAHEHGDLMHSHGHTHDATEPGHQHSHTAANAGAGDAGDAGDANAKDIKSASAGLPASPSVPGSTEDPADAPAIKELAAVIETAVKEATAPLVARIAELEADESGFRSYFTPRINLDPSKAPSESKDNLVTSKSLAELQRAKATAVTQYGLKADEQPGTEGLPDQLAWYGSVGFLRRAPEQPA